MRARAGWPQGSGEMAARIRAHDWARTPLGPVADWPQSLRTAVELLLPSGFGTVVLWGPDLIQIYNDVYRDLMGAKHPHGLGQPTQACWPEVWHINRPIYERVRAGETVTLRDALFPISRCGRTEDAWFTLSYSPLRDEAGGIEGILVAVFETTGEHRVEATLRDSEARFRALASLVPALLWRSDAAGRVNSSNQRWLDHTGQTFAESQDGGWLDAIHPEDREAAQAAFAAGHAGCHAVEIQLRIRGTGGRYRWFLVRQVPIPEAQGALTEWFGAAMDIDDLRRLQVRQEVLVHELQHRTRNLIAVIDGIARQTLGASPSLDAFADSFPRRLSALSRVQGLLSRADSDPVTLETLVRMELEAHGAPPDGARVRVAGPAVSLPGAMVQTLALAVHELATNARKHGVLAAGCGRLAVFWRIATAPDGERRLVLEWIEEGASIRTAGPPRIGYGRELIEHALPFNLEAHTTYELGDGGVRCTIDLPLERVASRQSSGAPF